MRVAVIDAPDGGYIDQLDIEEEIIGSVAPVHLCLISEDNRNELFDIEDTCIILWHRVPLGPEFFERNSQCRAVVCASVGYDHVDVAAAKRCGVSLYHIPHYGTEEVADHTLALFLSAARRLSVLTRHVQSGGWDWRRAHGVHRLRGASWGIVGLGRIGLAVAARVKAFGIHVAFYDPYNHPGVEKSLDLLRKTSLDQLLADSDVVSLHAPLTEQTHHMIGRSQLETMRSDAYLINTARGALIDVDALKGSLAAGRPGVVALDVVEHEPALPPWLVQHPQVMLTPHSAFYSAEALTELRIRAASAALEVVSGAPVTAAVRVV